MLMKLDTRCEAALDAAKREKKSQNYISKIKKLIAQGKKDHDEVKATNLLWVSWVQTKSW